MRILKDDNEVKRKYNQKDDVSRPSQDLKLIDYKEYSLGFFVLFFLIGLLNNNTYVVINTGAQDLAEKFNKKDLMGSFTMYTLFMPLVV